MNVFAMHANSSTKRVQLVTVARGTRWCVVWLVYCSPHMALQKAF